MPGAVSVTAPSHKMSAATKSGLKSGTSAAESTTDHKSVERFISILSVCANVPCVASNIKSISVVVWFNRVAFEH